MQSHLPYKKLVKKAQTKLNPYANLSDRICFEFTMHSLNFQKVNEINNTKS